MVILNKSHFRPNSEKNPYELWHGRLTIVKHFIIFGRKFYIKRNDEKLGKFDARVDEDIFLGYSHNNKGCICYNKKPRGSLSMLIKKRNNLQKPVLMNL